MNDANCDNDYLPEPPMATRMQLPAGVLITLVIRSKWSRASSKRIKFIYLD